MTPLSFTVTSADTARALASGDLAVLGTPRLLAWMEQATLVCLAPLLAADETSVGTRIELEHLAATRVGATVALTAELVHTDGRLRRFSVAAQDAGGRLLGTATVTRVVVDRERFMQRVPAAS
jgi:fluoroacetyl-CoA thioesterase